jgi:predicted AAA+ superfamily ATPase
MLNSIQQPIAVITIAGVYRSGKSYLVNRLLKNKQNGFATGSSV